MFERAKKKDLLSFISDFRQKSVELLEELTKYGSFLEEVDGFVRTFDLFSIGSVLFRNY